MTAPDGGWGWIVLLSSFLIVTINAGVVRAFAIWYIELLERFEASSALTEWIISLHTALRFCCYPIGAILYRHWSLQTLAMVGGSVFSLGILGSAFAESFVLFLLSFSVVGGIGSGFLSFGYQMAISEYFELRRALAFGLALSGVGVGNLVFPPMLTLLFESIGYFDTVVVLAGITLQTVVASALIFPVYEEVLFETEEMDETQSLLMAENKRWKVRKLAGKRSIEWDLLCNPIVICYIVAGIVGSMGSFSVLQLLVSFAVERGVSLELASFLLSIAGPVEMVGRPVGGLVLSHPRIRPHTVLIWTISKMLQGVGALSIAFSWSFWQFVPGIVLTAICRTIGGTFSPVVFGQVFESSAFASTFSLYKNALGIGMLGGGAIAGQMKDISGSYFHSYLLMSGICFGASFAFWASFCLARQLRDKERYRLKTAALR